MTSLRKCTLGDLLRIKHGFAFLGEYFSDSGTHVVLTPGNFFEHGGFRAKGDKEKWYSGPVPEEYVLREGDVLVAMTEQAEGLLGASATIPADGRYLHNQRLGLVQLRDPKQADIRFLYHLFNSVDVRQQLRASSTGLKIRHTAPSRIEAVTVQVPPLSEQRRIASILSAYDDLIENCERRLQVLDEMARTLYREWFVLFRCPGCENTPLVDSALGRVPNGWTVSSLKTVTSKIGSGATPRGGKEAYQTKGVALIRSMNIYDYRFDFDNLAFINDEQADQLDNVVVEPRDVLLNITGASVARCTMVPSHILPARVNQHVAIVRADPTRIDPYYVLDSINNERTKAQLLGLAQGGATREALTKATVSNFPLLLPPSSSIFRYGSIAGPMHAEREALTQQQQVLRQTREILLPRLLSGELSVEDAA